MGWFRRKKKGTPKVNASLVNRVVSLLNSRAIAAQYTALNPQPDRKPVDIRTDYTETEQVFYQGGSRSRQRMYQIGSNLYDNVSIGSSVDLVIRMALSNGGGTPIFTDEESADYQQTRWAEFSRDCGYFNCETWNELLQQVLRAVIVHGDCLVVFDDFLTEGKVAVYDADQITNIGNFEEWRRTSGFPEGCRQVEGVVISQTGKVLGYFLTMERNCQSVGNDRASFIPVTMGKLIYLKRKLSQYRGESLLLPMAELLDDTNDLLKSEIRAAQITAELAFVVKKATAVSENLEGVLEGFSEDERTELTQASGLTDEDVRLLDESAKGTDSFGAFAGKASIGTISNDSDIVNLNNANRPSAQIQAWLDNLQLSAGQRLGIMSIFSKARCDSSFSSGTLESNISWETFREYQQLLENQLVRHVIEFVLPHSKYVVSWNDDAIAVDPEKSEKVLDMRLRSGRTTYRDMLGVRWREKLRQLAEEKKYIEQLDLSGLLTLWQTSSGAVIEESTPENTVENQTDRPAGGECDERDKS